MYDSNIKNIIFDWSGVINDNVRDVYETVNAIIKEVRGEGITFQQFRSRWVSPYMEFYRKFLPEVSIEEQKRLYIKFFKEHNTNTVFAGMEKVVLSLKKRGIRMVILSSDHPIYLHDEIAAYGLTECFEQVYCDVHDKRHIVEEVIKNHNFHKAETLFVGDTQNDDQAGKHAGIRTALVTWGFCNIRQIKACKPTYIINKPNEFIKLIMANRKGKI
jgi:phosphoglycolate phosphatase-like HAD superfamily hydrolase